MLVSCSVPNVYNKERLVMCVHGFSVGMLQIRTALLKDDEKNRPPPFYTLKDYSSKRAYITIVHIAHQGYI